MFKSPYKLILLFYLALLMGLLSTPQPVFAQWPPFKFSLTPSYNDGKITYQIAFASRVDWTMTDITFKIPLPAGTRFVEANAEPSTHVDFNGAEITFFTTFYQRPPRNSYFVVEVADAERTEFVTHAWISWIGDQPGEYHSGEVAIDITRNSLDWSRPRLSPLQLEAEATFTDEVITYSLYPKKINSRRMWDVKINIPIPAGTAFLEADSSPPFAASFDGREVSFTIVELEKNAEIDPLRFRVSTSGITVPFLSTHAWATWKNVGYGVGSSIAGQGETRTGDIVVRLGNPQQIVGDLIGDVPFPSYDLSSIAIQEDPTAYMISFYTAGELEPVGSAPLEYSFYIDQDCRVDTGNRRKNRGAEYLLRYRQEKDKADLIRWYEEEGRWGWTDAIALDSLAAGKMVSLWLPYTLFQDSQKFCWVAQTKNNTTAFDEKLPIDWLPDNTLNLTSYETIGPASAASASSLNTDLANTVPIYYGDNDYSAPLAQTQALSSSAVSDLNGKLAVPIDNGRVLYDLYIYALPEGQEIARIPNARQPNIRFDGQRMLINREGGGIENIFEYDFSDGSERQVSDAPRDSHPFYDLWGNRVVYGNPELTVSNKGSDRKPYLFVQCSLLPPHQEADPRCHNLPWLGILVPANQMGDIQGTHPVWTINDRIVYKGCNTWSGSERCGIFSVPSSSTKGFSNGFIPKQITGDTSDIPADTKGNLIAFTSYRDDNWEAYVMDLDGSNVKNLSNSPQSNDGIPTISPDGSWVAFVSDRDGSWEIWVAPISGGEPEKLFSLPDTPWGDGDRTWTNERISWGP